MLSRHPAPTAAFALLRLTRALAHIPGKMLSHAALTRSRRGLSRLDDHLLKDIGLTRDEAEAEAKRPVWDAPLHWKG